MIIFGGKRFEIIINMSKNLKYQKLGLTYISNCLKFSTKPPKRRKNGETTKVMIIGNKNVFEVLTNGCVISVGCKLLTEEALPDVSLLDFHF